MFDTVEYEQQGTVEETLRKAAKDWPLEHLGRRVIRARAMYALNGKIGIEIEHEIDTSFGDWY